MAQPLLTIGIIFKNEIRCLERCLKSLQPLREAVPCQLVMADTGSNDGSREVAERYADVLFDFLWVNDFAAARNAVMDRAEGKWFMTMDADEWLDEEFSGLTAFLRSRRRWTQPACTLLIRNYLFETLEKGEYRDFTALRMVLLSSGARYEGAIHEHFNLFLNQTINLPRVMLHHDGYVGLNEERGKEKRERNLAVLRKELEENPENITALLQYLESGRRESDFQDRIRQGAAAVLAKRPGWDNVGAPFMRYAVSYAKEFGMPELEEWIAQTDGLFPKSIFTRIDVSYTAAVNHWDKKEYSECVRRGEAALKAILEYRAGKGDLSGLAYSTLQLASHRWERMLRIILARANYRNGSPDRAFELMESVDCSLMDADQTRHYLWIMVELNAGTDLDVSPLMTRFYELITKPTPTEDAANERRALFYAESSTTFDPQYRQKEEISANFRRHDYTAFRALAGRCEIGSAAAILETEDGPEMERLLATVEDWDLLPIAGLERALLAGVSFPPKPLNQETADKLAGRMGWQGGPLAQLTVQYGEQDFAGDLHRVFWARGVVLAAVHECQWQEDRDFDVCRGYARVEEQFLPLYYAPELLREENIHVLPSLHRFGWYCAQAFRALEEGDAPGYVRLLRGGLTACEGMKPAVEFLVKHLERQQEARRNQAPPELLALAEQVRMMLSMYPADDPAVAALKASPAYQQVKDFIEGPVAHEMGGALPQ